MPEPFDASAMSVPPLGRWQLVLVDGRTFAISDDAGQMAAPTHGMVHDDLRHLSRMTVAIDDAYAEVLASSAPTPLSAVVVARVRHSTRSTVTAVLTRRRWVANGLREDVHIHNTSPHPQHWTMRVHMAADFAHVFDVKAGMSAPDQQLSANGTGWKIVSPVVDAVTDVRAAPDPDEVDLVAGTLAWHVHLDPRSEAVVTLTVEPVVDGAPAGLAFPCGTVPAEAIPMRRLDAWRAAVPTVVSTDPRLSVAVDQALADIAALRIVDSAHVDRAVIAAGAPWFMTLFGRDSLLTSWMTLPFEPHLAVGVLASLAELQGKVYDPVAEEQPGKILHELRRHGGNGPFASRQRYYGTVDATALFVMLAAEARRWGALGEDDLHALGPAVDAALDWILGDGDSDGDGFVDYHRGNSAGLANQGWKDSWDGVTYADGSMPRGTIALAEVQGYVYAALLGGAELAGPMALGHDPRDLEARAARLRERFNELFWDAGQGWFALGLDGDGRRIDSLTTNPGHALWCGMADEELANRFLDRLMEPDVWSGWGLRTLAETMAAYDPLSYHNGSVWPHDTALCAAGAAHYGRWDVVDRIVQGAFDAATEFNGRPPELFAGISRSEAPVPVAYPASCSPQAWSSASILLLLRSMLGLRAGQDGKSLELTRGDLSAVPDLVVERLRVGGHTLTVRVANQVVEARTDAD